MEIQSDNVCLDIGCGGGANIRKLLEKSPYGRVVGIDYSEISVEKSRKINKAGIESKRCEILQGDVMKLPFRDKTFDVITAFETIYFWPDISEAFKKVYKILKIGGTFLICNESNGENPKDEKWTKIIQGMKIYNSEQIEKSLENAGLRDVKVDKTKKGWIYERHVLLSSWLERLGVDPDIASQDACKIEHVISSESFEAIKKHIK